MAILYRPSLLQLVEESSRTGTIDESIDPQLQGRLLLADFTLPDMTEITLCCDYAYASSHPAAACRRFYAAKGDQLAWLATRRRSYLCAGDYNANVMEVLEEGKIGRSIANRNERELDVLIKAHKLKRVGEMESTQVRRGVGGVTIHSFIDSIFASPSMGWMVEGMRVSDELMGDEQLDNYHRTLMCAITYYQRVAPPSTGNALRLDKMTKEDWEAFEKGGAARAVRDMLGKLDGRLTWANTIRAVDDALALEIRDMTKQEGGGGKGRGGGKGGVGDRDKKYIDMHKWQGIRNALRALPPYREGDDPGRLRGNSTGQKIARDMYREVGGNMPPAVGELWSRKLEPLERQKLELDLVEKILEESRSEFYTLDRKERGDRVTRVLHEVMITSPGRGPTVVWRALAALDRQRDKKGVYGRRLRCSRLYERGSNGSRTVEGEALCEQLAESHEMKWREGADHWRAVEHAIQISGIMERGNRARAEWANDWTTWCFARRRYFDQVHRMRLGLATADDRQLYTWKRAGEEVIELLRLLHIALAQSGTVLGEQEMELIVLADKGKRDKLEEGAWRGISLTVAIQHLERGVMRYEYERVSRLVRSLCNTGYKPTSLGWCARRRRRR